MQPLEGVERILQQPKPFAHQPANITKPQSIKICESVQAAWTTFPGKLVRCPCRLLWGLEYAMVFNMHGTPP
jgi:hypothetical protein